MNELPPRAPPPGTPSLSGAGRTSEEHALIHASGLLDAGWYEQRYPEIAGTGTDPVIHFITRGWREGRNPNLYFDTSWYLKQNPDVSRAGLNPLLHYIRRGEAENRLPCLHFDLPWYRTRHTAPEGGTLLGHYYTHRRSGTVTPIAEFDPAWYLAQYPDIAAAGVDPFEHFLLWGWREGRNPSADFDTRFYVRRYLDPGQDENPLLHYRRLRHVIRLHTRPPPDETTIPEEVRRFTAPGPEFEEIAPLPRSAPRRATVLAFYLPQFHAIPENDAWWGRGFTEWTFTARGLPRFAGHYQPRIPRDLGHYVLDNPTVLRRQVELARGAGLGGFIFYFYWFNGRRLLERPLEAFLADHSIDFPFCLMWANENWTRRWDGSDQDVLIAQDWRRRDETALVDSFARHFRDPRYIRLHGRPLLMVYRAGLIPESAATLARWREAFRVRHHENPVMVMSQSFDAFDPRGYGFDGAVEFPPHKLVLGQKPINGDLAWFDLAATAQVFDYGAIANASLAEPPAPFPLIKTAVPGWDNDARRQGAGMMLHRATPAKYQAWLSELIDRAAAHPFFGERLVCVNAWNEWAEGAYLEPDQHYGGAWLNATARAVAARFATGAPLLLVGHDGFAAGAQQLLLHLGRILRRRFGVTVEFLLLGEGTLRPRYATTAPTQVITDPSRLQPFLLAAAARGITTALVNSAAAAWSIPQLRAAGIEPTLLVHEMPGLLAEKRLLAGARAGAQAAGHVIFAAEAVRAGFTSAVPIEAERSVVLPQGNYRDVAFSITARAALRARLGVPDETPVVLGAGYADLRKGFDLFLQCWRLTRHDRPQVRFWWVGELDATLHAYLSAEIEAAEATGSFHLAGWQDDIAAWLSAADLFALPSREDPYPTILIEALCSGLRAVAFDHSGGMPDLLRERDCGEVVPMGDAAALSAAILRELDRPAGDRAALAQTACQRFRFDHYAFALLQQARPGLPAVSVAVPAHNYARYLEHRLVSVFTQTHPVVEVIVLDDASRDDSVAVAQRVAADWGRDIRLIVNPTNSGSPFAQWHRAAELAEAEWVWIAEADDAAEPTLLATLAAFVHDVPELELAFCDSRAIDAQGAPLWPSYHDYYVQSGAPALTQGGVFPAPDFARRFLAERNLIPNVSAVLWRRRSLLAALHRCGRELSGFHLAGDWRIYLEILAESTGQVGVAPTSLNVHRRHAAGVTQSTAARRHLDEVTRIHAIARSRLDLPPETIRRQGVYRRHLAHTLGLR
ncbi:Glycosyltransferase [Rhodovastum atsumiense]|uniref:Glycosyltransferase n=1 Tax=Rhodovastum atsumiense TaxID=504468 RepID=A0A5M6IXE6_9PROT|nr:glycoside hydrolase family 99-like domain-containing protein [Rhodovastum atsumiense]KAA5612931.1 glycosyltransferase [Rhodovastum atsumiense]CAH2600984.1 Glycosyltransferase [Rhodovastum atsumiense]